ILDAGFNLLSLANNHSVDAGVAGVVDSIALLERKRADGKEVWWGGTGATAADARRSVVFTPPGKNARVAFFAVANTGASSVVASLHDPTLPERIRAARAEA